MTTFFTLDQAAWAIAAEIHPVDAEKRDEIAVVFRARMYDALCAGTLIGRDPETRLQIDHRNLSAPIAFGGSVLRDVDLNAWLESLGVGVHPIAETSARALTRASASASSLPATAKLAHDFGPFLSDGKDADWLKRVLGDLRNRPDLARFRTLSSRPKGSLWRPAGVALWLVKNKYMSNNAARAALRDNYPDDEAYLP